jgi:hypothetical protein
MTKETIDLAQRLLAALPKSEVKDLIAVLTHYNAFGESERSSRLATKVASARASVTDPQVERDIVEFSQRSAGQKMYLSGPSKVCTCCGK